MSNAKISMRTRGYIRQALFENFFLNGIELITKVKNNMKNSQMSVKEKILPRKCALIETVEKKPAIDVCFVNDGQLTMF